MAETDRRGFTLVELMAVVTIIGVLAAISIPSFLASQGRAKTTEAKANLRAIYTAQQTYLQESNAYSRHVAQLGFVPERNNRYSYDLGPDIALRFDRRSNAPEVLLGTETGFTSDQTQGYPPMTPKPAIAGVTDGPGSVFTATAVGNIDADSGRDQWSIASTNRRPGNGGGASSTAARSDGEGVCDAGAASAGEPCHDARDI